MEITERDIGYAKEMILPYSETFDTQRIEVIKCLESKDVQACPGSGKTTTLLAKLAIIAKKMPLDGNRGICVLTHTNVAIDEIKARVGTKGNILFNYPNFFGTIQSFVDKFLAIPAYEHYYGKSIYTINNDIYFETLEKLMSTIPYGTRSWLKHSKKEFCVDFLKDIRFGLDDFNCIIEGLNKEPVFKSNCESATNLLNFKLKILQEGVLCFDDAYSLAFRYFRDYGDLIEDVISERFAFVFIDEMQDIDIHQIQLINKIFNQSKVTMQRIGDPNQAIFASRVKDTIWKSNEECLKIDGSKRFSNAIAQKVKFLCVKPQNITGNENIPNIPPKILAFNDDTIGRILDEFAKLIVKNELHLLNRKIFKAVGWVGKERDDGKRTIPSYWGKYNKAFHSNKLDFDSLSDYLQATSNDVIVIEGANYYRKSLIRSILKVLRLLGIKNKDSKYFTESSFLTYLEETYPELYRDLNLRLADWCLKIHNHEAFTSDLKGFIVNDILEKFGAKTSAEVNEFLDASATKGSYAQKDIGNYNTFQYKSNGIDVNIDVSTIHRVKGETHTATLYLETFYIKYDTQRIMKYLKAEKVRPKPSDFNAQKMAYVGMTRPTHLLCIAIHEENLNGSKEELQAAGWEIIVI
jgi:DNA helicase II / ATP-dependent DNA helicase PcrA